MLEGELLSEVGCSYRGASWTSISTILDAFVVSVLQWLNYLIVKFYRSNQFGSNKAAGPPLDLFPHASLNLWLRRGWGQLCGFNIYVFDSLWAAFDWFDWFLLVKLICRPKFTQTLLGVQLLVET